MTEPILHFFQIFPHCAKALFYMINHTHLKKIFSFFISFFQLTVIVAPTFDFECSDKGIFSHQSDCARFWLCKAQNGEPELYKCPAGMYWISRNFFFKINILYFFLFVGYLFNDEKHRCVEEGEVSCAKTPDLLRISSEPAPIQLRVSQLESFFAQWSRF